uniref:Uncharacterized protein n=1 Tax=Aegilops tauschii subsp. strangulata TaxID=200361 RepID=A0A453EPL7_AEGTS
MMRQTEILKINRESVIMCQFIEKLSIASCCLLVYGLRLLPEDWKQNQNHFSWLQMQLATICLLVWS